MIWFGALVLALGWVIGYLFGNVSLWMTIALVMALVQIWASYWYSDKIVLTMTGTRLVDPNQSNNKWNWESNLKQHIYNL